MATDKRQFTMRMQQDNFDKIRVIAAVNKRSMAMQIEYLLEKCISEYESAHGQIPLVGDTVQNTFTNSGTFTNNGNFANGTFNGSNVNQSAQ